MLLSSLSEGPGNFQAVIKVRDWVFTPELEDTQSKQFMEKEAEFCTKVSSNDYIYIGLFVIVNILHC